MTKILLVEDDKSLREIYGVRLLAEGYDIVSAGDGEEALAMAIKERPDLIISDVMMPKISGFDMLDILRSTTETRDIKVIMMTALSSEDQRQRGEQLGADRYLVKSQVGIEDVVRTVHDVLGDTPAAIPTPQQTFGTPTPSAVPRSAAGPSPAQQPQPQTAAAPQQPTATQPQPAATPAPPAAPTSAPDTTATAAPAATNPQPPQPASSSLPQPTAPFSTPRPAGLGDRIVQPLNAPSDSTDMSALIEQELSSITGGAPAAPQPAPAPPAPQAPAFDQPAAPQQTPAAPESHPAAPAAPAAPSFNPIDSTPPPQQQ